MEKKQEKIIVVVLILVILALAFGISYSVYSRTSKEYTYLGPAGNFSFVLDRHTGNDVHILALPYMPNSLWEKTFLIPFNYGPEELEGIYTEEVRELIIDSPEIYMVRDVYLDEKTQNNIAVAILNVDRVVGQDMLTPPIYNIPITFGAIEENSLSQGLGLQVMTCEDAHAVTTVIWFKEGTENKIYKENEYCVVVEFKEGENPIKSATRLVYHITGVM
ncbi:hypothetical protein HOG16_00985 [Candidatus Woesearchaeota archaeon]|nr:hypothetical protein [Candidatus Woesearchaeota archaeon]MBT4322074.1 hypothetical protein [Candidatus Woesearchaeota archaeon]MBT4630651.1 hypothetical protein [Candidatus Woesearchaeota archaeon]